MDLDFSLLTFSPSGIKKNLKSSVNRKCSKLAKNRQVNADENSKKKWISSNLSSTKEIPKSNLSSKCSVEPFITNSDKTLSKIRTRKGKENRFNNYVDLSCDQDLAVSKTVNKVQSWGSPDVVPGKKKRLMDKGSPKQTPSFLEKSKASKTNSPRKKTSNSPAISLRTATDNKKDPRTNDGNADDNVVVSSSVIIISDSGSESSDIIDSSPKTNYKSPWSGKQSRKNFLQKGTTIVLESSDGESEVSDKVPLTLQTCVSHAQANKIHFPVNSTPLLPAEGLSSNAKYKDIQSWISKIPPLENSDETSDSHDICVDREQENMTDNIGFSTSADDLLRNLYGPSLPSDFRVPRTEPLKKKCRKCMQSNVAHSECVMRKRVQDRSLNSTKSEDFENFLKRVHHDTESKNKESKSEKNCGSFINDEDENDSIAFYQAVFNTIRNDDLKNDKLSSDSSSSWSKKRHVNVNRKLIFSSRSSSSEDSDSKVKRRGKKNSDPFASTDSSRVDSESEIKAKKKKNSDSSDNKETSSEDSRSKLKTRRKKKSIESSDRKKEIRTIDKKKTNVKRTPKFVSSPIKRLVKTAPKPSHKKLKRLSLQSSVSPRQSSFLASLSSNAVGDTHPEGVFYKNNFKKKKEELCKKLFKMYNNQVFDNKLPGDLLFEWNVRMKKTAGFCYNRRTLQSPGTKVRTSRIVFSTKVCDTAERLRDTLIHELCHAATWILDSVKDGHGPHWKSWARKAMNTFPELPPIKRCHDYKIQTKFTYRCKSCGYSIGRHSKSLDLATKRCGLCFGEFELLVNARRNSGTVVQQSVKKKSPVGFARYVKENYNAVKTSQANMKHADVMRLLGQQFSAVKIGSKKSQ